MKETIHIRRKRPGHLLTYCEKISQTHSTISYEHYYDSRAQDHITGLVEDLCSHCCMLAGIERGKDITEECGNIDKLGWGNK